MPRPFFAEGTFTTDQGEVLTLVCDFGALDVIEGITGENWSEVVPALAGNPLDKSDPGPPKALLIKVLYGLLRRRHASITIDEAAGLMYDKHADALGAIMGDVIGRACNFADGEEAKGKNPPKPHGQSSDSESSG